MRPTTNSSQESPALTTRMEILNDLAKLLLCLLVEIRHGDMRGKDSVVGVEVVLEVRGCFSRKVLWVVLASVQGDE